MKLPTLFLATFLLYMQDTFAEVVKTGNANSNWTIAANGTTNPNNHTTVVKSFRLLDVASDDDQLYSKSNPCQQGCCNTQGYVLISTCIVE
jgi:hypothetical protein